MQPPACVRTRGGSQPSKKSPFKQRRTVPGSCGEGAGISGRDPKSRIITAVHVIPGNENEPTKLKRQVDKFSYDANGDRLLCPEGKTSIAKTRRGNGDLYQFSMKDCVHCPGRESCLRPSELSGSAQPRARVYIGDVLRRKLAAGEAGSEFRRQSYGERYKVEGLFSEQKGPRSRLGFARSSGIVEVEIQALFTAIAANARRTRRWLAKRSSEAVPAALPGAA